MKNVDQTFSGKRGPFLAVFILALSIASSSAGASELKKGAEVLLEKRIEREATVIDNEMLSAFPTDAWVAYFDSVESPSTSDVFSDQTHDPIEKINRVTFVVNDKLYRWIIDPTGTVYGFVVPLYVRKGIRRIAYNLAVPVRLVNNFAQGKFKGAGREILRFLVNSTVGLAGFFDPATHLGIKKAEQDSGLTLGKYGFGPGFYVMIPLLGPSSARDGVGAIFDALLNPVTYAPLGVSVFVRYNDAVLAVPEYEEKTRNHFDPYSRIREYYSLLRKAQVRSDR